MELYNRWKKRNPLAVIFCRSGTTCFFLAADKEYYYFLYLEYGHSETTDPLKRYVIDKTGLELKDNDNPAVIKVKFKI